MSDYWCATCREWQSREDRFSFFLARCEECGTKLEPDTPPEHVVIDYKEVDVSWAFEPEDEDDSDDSDDESDADGDSDGDGDSVGDGDGDGW
jgi:hypothetical protein